MMTLTMTRERCTWWVILAIIFRVTSSQHCGNDFSVVYETGGPPVFTVSQNGSCSCSGKLSGNGTEITGLDQNPAVLSLVGTLNAVISNQSATIASLSNSVNAMQAQIAMYEQARQNQSAAIAALQVQLAAANSSCFRNGLSAATAALSCKALVGLVPSGFYYIQTVTGVQNIFCDMNTDGGGWTQVFKSGTTDRNSASIPWNTGMGGTGWSPIANSAYMMFAYTDASNNIVSSLASPWKFPTPAQFQTQTPMQIGQCVYIPITATRLADGSVVSKILRAGWGSFGSTCDEGCTSTWGQICLKSNAAQGVAGGYSDFPTFHSFAVSNADSCSLSSQVYTTTACSASYQFTIYVR
eukprot:TRINITY_DN8255_c0_g1_i2.p1 TRINITY_DN8255_c0_g1~~TRINITY_DN8255_c0_g1_i2.p1  ORF type:complete len:354 (+),score=55.05 TRINITY_DN8255_c0_g1_i2:127-1188(+)